MVSFALSAIWLLLGKSPFSRLVLKHGYLRSTVSATPQTVFLQRELLIVFHYCLENY